MTRTAKALATIESLITGQELAKARIWGSVEKAHAKSQIVGCTNLAQSPELTAVAPTRGTFTIGAFEVIRTQCDQVDNFYCKRL